MIKKYVITGGPCSGKTKTLEALGRQGFLTVQEVARIVVAEERKDNAHMKTWDGNVNERQERILHLQLKLEREGEEKAIKEGKKIMFIDRGIPDGIVYYKISETPLPKNLREESKPERRNYEMIFFLEPVSYRCDATRREPLEIARQMHDLLYKTYGDLGYNITKVPAMPLKERVKFIKGHL